MTAKVILPVIAALALHACTSSEDREIKDFLARQDSHWTEIKSDVDTPGPDRLRVTCKGKPVDFKLLPCPELKGNGSLIEFETEAGTATSVINLP